ncbi:MAG: hypothetical protein IJO24_02550 [Clostridia bacterium]|nr:hypothetical protein [Clostridia bacterium]
MDKILKAAGIIGIVLFVISLVVAFFGFLIGSETFFYTGISLLFFVLPVYFVVFLLILLIAAIIEEKTK